MELARFDRPASSCNVEAYLGGMFKACEFCLTHENRVPLGPEWPTKPQGEIDPKPIFLNPRNYPEAQRF